MLTGEAAVISVAPSADQVLLLAVGAEPALGEVHHLGAGLGVLHLGDVDLVRTDAGHLEGPGGGGDGRRVAARRRAPG